MDQTSKRPTNDSPAALANAISGHILVVDDEPINLDVATRILHRAGFATTTATSGLHALQLLATKSFDLVLLDIMMPDMDGFEVCTRLRQELKLGTLPVIFVTALGDETHLARAFAAGANDYVVKPYRKVEMIARTKAAVERNIAVRRYAELQCELEKLVAQRTQQLHHAVEEVERQNAFNSSVLGTVLSGIVTIDAQGRVLSFNKMAEKIFGYSATEVIGDNVSMLMPEPYRSHHDEYITNFVTSGRARIIGSGREVMGRHKNGSVFPVELAVSEMWVGGTRMFTGVVHDISTRRAMQSALERANERLIQQSEALYALSNPSSGRSGSLRETIKLLAETCANSVKAQCVAILLADYRLELPLLSFAGDQHQAATLAASMNLADPDIRARLNAERVVTTLGASTTGNDPAKLQQPNDEHDLLTIDAAVVVGTTVYGVIRCVRSAEEPWHLDERNFVGFLASQAALLIETQLRHQAEAQLRASEARLRNAQRIARLGDWQWDFATDKITFSAGLQFLLFPRPSQSLNTLDDFLQCLHADDRASLSQALNQCRAEQLPFSIDLNMLRNNEVLHLQGRGEPVLGDSGQSAGISFTLLDVTALKHAELALKDMRDNLQEKVNEQTRDLIEARDEALAAERTMSTFLANMSHEIRTPLHAILSYARFGEKQTAEPNSPAAEHFREIHDSGSDLLALLNDLLDLSKLKAGKIVYDFQAVGLRDLITEVVNKFGPLMKEKGIIAVTKFHGTEHPLSIDGRKLAQVLGNLLSNAIKFSPANSIVKLDTTYNDDGSIHLTVCDKGVGIPPDELQAIFNPFIQGSRTKSNAGGTGLGLAICKEIIENGHHGKIFADNNPDGGACFFVTLPATTKQTN